MAVLLFGGLLSFFWQWQWLFCCNTKEKPSPWACSRSFSQYSGHKYWAGRLPGHLRWSAVGQAAPALPHSLVCGSAKIENCLKMGLGHNPSIHFMEKAVRVWVFSEGQVEIFAPGPSTLRASNISWPRLLELPGIFLRNPGNVTAWFVSS